MRIIKITEQGATIVVHQPTPAPAKVFARGIIREVVGNGTPGGSLVPLAATKAAANALTLSAGEWVRVAADESNNGDKSMYLYTGSALEFHYTIP